MEIRSLLGGIVISGVGAGGAVLEWPRVREGLRSSRWPGVQGRVTSSEFKGGPPAGRYIRTSTGRAVITYQYEVNGHELTGERVFVGDEEFGSAYEAQRRTRHYYSGVSVQVYYDPAAPSRAVLEPGLTWSSGWRFVTSLLLLIGAVAGLIWL